MDLFTITLIIIVAVAVSYFAKTAGREEEVPMAPLDFAKSAMADVAFTAGSAVSGSKTVLSECKRLNSENALARETFGVEAEKAMAVSYVGGRKWVDNDLGAKARRIENMKATKAAESRLAEIKAAREAK